MTECLCCAFDTDEHQDAFLFALEYAADMVKVDACADTLPALELVTRWQTQLNQTGTPTPGKIQMSSEPLNLPPVLWVY